MKQIFNWTIGSFFRTIGRTIAFLAMGGLIYYILSTNGFEFGIKDLFFENVKALTLTNEVNKTGDGFLTITETDFTEETVFYTKIINSSTNTQYIYYTPTTALNTSNHDYISFTLLASQPVRNLQTNSIEDWECQEWLQTNFGSTQYTGYECKYNHYDSDTQYSPYAITITQMNIAFRVSYTNNGWNMCTIQDNEVVCPTSKQNVSEIRAIINFKTAETTNFKLGLSRGYNLWTAQNVTNAIQDQTQQQQQNHEETQSYLEDSNTTQAESEATDFFEDFEAPDIGGLGAIITAPLNTIRSLLNSSCSNLVLPLPFVNKNLTLPCMNTIYTEHFGAFFTIYQTIILAVIAYRCIRSIFFDIHGFTNPNDDRIEVMDL